MKSGDYPKRTLENVGRRDLALKAAQDLAVDSGVRRSLDDLLDLAAVRTGLPREQVAAMRLSPVFEVPVGAADEELHVGIEDGRLVVCADESKLRSPRPNQG